MPLSTFHTFRSSSCCKTLNMHHQTTILYSSFCHRFCSEIIKKVYLEDIRYVASQCHSQQLLRLNIHHQNTVYASTSYNSNACSAFAPFTINPSHVYYWKNTTPISTYKGTWDKTRWCHVINSHIPTELLRSRRQSSVACIYGTSDWGARGPGFEIRTKHHDFCSSFCLFHSSVSSFTKKNTKWVRVNGLTRTQAACRHGWDIKTVM